LDTKGSQDSVLPDLGYDKAEKGNKTRLGGTSGNVVAQLRNMILEGHYVHEERLPAERNLADEFNVSRGTTTHFTGNEILISKIKISLPVKWVVGPM
jgi:hypothetical protein